MEVILASCGNPDHFQDPYQPMWGCDDNRKAEINSLEEASRLCLEFIRNNELGGGNWAGGQVLENDQIVARIGYNGRILLPDDKYFNVGDVFWEHKLHAL